MEQIGNRLSESYNGGHRPQGATQGAIRNRVGAALLCAVVLSGCGESAQQANQPEVDYQANAARWIADEFQPSTLSQAEAAAEMAWFSQAAEPFRGMSINVVSETLTTHEYEAETLTRAFFDITGIRVT
ncbi:MAG: hypothetical protein RIC89_02405, partial [Pseudomonadales bacterium]